MKFKESLENIKLDLTKLVIIPHGGSGRFISEFEIDPKDFLKYAKEDLHSDGDKGTINALSNAKRAIDCQIDEVLCGLGINYQILPKAVELFVNYYTFKDDISYKLKIIQGLNLAPGLIITKVRALRNKLEHFYKRPTIDEVKEAIDIADLFIRSVDGKLKNQTNEFSITDEENFISHFEFKKGYSVNFSPENGFFEIYENRKLASKIGITNNDPEFYGFVRLMNSIDDEYELTESFKVICSLINHPIPSKHINVEQC